MAESRLSQSDIHDFLTSLHRDGFGTLEKGPSLQGAGRQLWLTLLDDASPGQLRIRKLVLSISGGPTREWFTTHPQHDRWSDIDSDSERSSEELLALVKALFLQAIGR